MNFTHKKSDQEFCVLTFNFPSLNLNHFTQNKLTGFWGFGVLGFWGFGVLGC